MNHMEQHQQQGDEKKEKRQISQLSADELAASIVDQSNLAVKPRGEGFLTVWGCLLQSENVAAELDQLPPIPTRASFDILVQSGALESDIRIEQKKIVIDSKKHRSIFPKKQTLLYRCKQINEQHPRIQQPQQQQQTRSVLTPMTTPIRSPSSTPSPYTSSPVSPTTTPLPPQRQSSISTSVHMSHGLL